MFDLVREKAFTLLGTFQKPFALTGIDLRIYIQVRKHDIDFQCLVVMISARSVPPFVIAPGPQSYSAEREAVIGAW